MEPEAPDLQDSSSSNWILQISGSFRSPAALPLLLNCRLFYLLLLVVRGLTERQIEEQGIWEMYSWGLG
jgi:hypothetical protein